jgi:Spy/CpxP family protein refolding chaperone
MNYFTKKKWGTLAVILLVVINISAIITIFVQQHAPGRPPQYQQGNALEATTHFLKTELQFSDDQVDVFIKLQDDFLKENEQYKRAIGNSKRKLYSALLLESADTTQNSATLAEIAKNTIALEKNSYVYFQEVKNLCTAEQQKKFDMLMGMILRKINPDHRPPDGNDRPLPPDHKNNRPPDGPPPHPPGKR